RSFDAEAPAGLIDDRAVDGVRFDDRGIHRIDTVVVVDVDARARVCDEVRQVAPQPEQAAEADEPPYLDVEAKVPAHGAVVFDVGDPGMGRVYRLPVRREVVVQVDVRPARRR